MATPVNEQYQLELFQEFERHLPAKWFKRLRNQEGPLFPLAWGLCGALAGVRESIEAAQQQAIALESEGFWLSLHLLGLGLARRAGETDTQARARYRFEFSQTRNTRQGMLTAIAVHSGLEPPAVRLETNFNAGAYGEVTLVIETAQRWGAIPWWWLGPFFREWVANGLQAKASLDTEGLSTAAFPPWDFYTRFPTEAEWLRPFWERPAFISDLRLIDFTRELEQKSIVFGLEGGWLFNASENYTLPAASAYSLGTFTSPINLVPSALTDNPISRNLLGFACLANFSNDSLRISEIWRSLSSAQQPGQPLLYVGDSAGCDYLLAQNIALPTPAFPEDSPLSVLGFGPWQLWLDDQSLPLAAQWWTDADAIARQFAPTVDNFGNAYLMLEFVLPKSTGFRAIAQLDLTLGYDQPTYSAVLGWSVPGPTAWSVPSANLWQLPTGENTTSLNTQLPVRSSVYGRSVNLQIPPGINGGFLLLLKIPVETVLFFNGNPLLFKSASLVVAK